MYICSLLPCSFPPSPFPPSLLLILLSLIFSACRSRRLFSRKDATSVRRVARAVTFRPSFLQNESIGRPLHDERRNFPAGTDDIFRENIGNFIPTSKINSSPSPPPVLGEEMDFISFQQGRTDFQSLLTANRFIAPLFFLAAPIFENWRATPGDRQRKYREFCANIYSQKLEPRASFHESFYSLNRNIKYFIRKHYAKLEIYFLI